MLLEAIRDLDNQNSEITIAGYGRLSLDAAKQSAIHRLEQTINELKNEDSPRTWRNANNMIYQNGVVKAMFDAIIKANEEQESGEI